MYTLNEIHKFKYAIELSFLISSASPCNTFISIYTFVCFISLFILSNSACYLVNFHAAFCKVKLSFFCFVALFVYISIKLVHSFFSFFVYFLTKKVKIKQTKFNVSDGLSVFFKYPGSTNNRIKLPH